MAKEVLDEAPTEVEKYSGKELYEIPTDALKKLLDFHNKCAKKLPPIMAAEHAKIASELSQELAKRGESETAAKAMEAYFRNTLRSVLKEAVARGIIKKDQKVEELIS